MELLEAFLIFIFAVIVSSVLHNMFPKIPTAFIQIGLGVIIFILPIPMHFEFDSEVFMMAVIAPLLFVEGTHVSRTKLLEYRKPIILMAMALVFTTVIGVGYFIHWIWPDLPMPAAFAIAAILCPTDAVAVSAITQGKVLPKGSMSILEGESLLNDAAGIISFKIAVTALVTGVFSAMNAIEQFIISTIIGILVGAIFGIIVVRVRIYLTANKGLKDNNTLTFIQLLTPFAVYFLAEELHASGIIAVVVAGLIHGLERDRLIRAQTELQMNFTQIWNTLSYALNGFVFVVLGFMVPEVLMEIVKEEPENIKFLITITLLIALAIYVFRFIWVFLWYKDFYFPKNIQYYMNESEDEETPPKRAHYAFIMTMCGIHGTISLSMALTLPYMINHGHQFEYRNDLLFIASLMVLISLILAQVILPLITPSEEEPQFKGMSYQSAKIFIVQNVIDHFKKESKEQPTVDYRQVMNQYFQELGFLLNIEPDNKNTKELRRLEDIAEDVETETLERLINSGKIDATNLRDYRSVMDATQAYNEKTFVEKFTRFFRMIYLRFKARKNRRKEERLVHKQAHAKLKEAHQPSSENKEKIREQREAYKNSRKELKEQREIRKQQFYGSYKQVQKILRIVNHHIVLRMKEEQNSSNVLEVSLVINQYYSLSRMLRSRSRYLTKTSKENGQHTNELVPEIQRELKLEGLYTQRSVLDELIKRNKITNEVATQIRENINYNEIVLSHESDE